MVTETPRLYLKELTPAMFATLFKNCSDEEIMAYLGLQNQEELETQRGNWNHGMTTYRTSFKLFRLVEKSTGSIIGKAGFHNWYAQHQRSEMGYVMSDENKKKMGYMTEALPAIVRYGFEQMELNRIEALISTDNVASLKLINGLGFTKEGTLRSHYCNNGKFEDSACYALLKEEYELRER